MSSLKEKMILTTTPPSLSFRTPTEHDVLFGKRLSRKYCRNGGNLLLFQLVEKRFEEHEAADSASDYIDRDTGKRDKMVLKKEILAAIKATGGRFLKKVSGCAYYYCCDADGIRAKTQKQQHHWMEVSDTEAIAKIVTTFRKVRAQRKRSEGVSVSAVNQNQQQSNVIAASTTSSSSDGPTSSVDTDDTVDNVTALQDVKATPENEFLQPPFTQRHVEKEASSEEEEVVKDQVADPLVGKHLEEEGFLPATLETTLAATTNGLDKGIAITTPETPTHDGDAAEESPTEAINTVADEPEIRGDGSGSSICLFEEAELGKQHHDEPNEDSLMESVRQPDTEQHKSGPPDDETRTDFEERVAYRVSLSDGCCHGGDGLNDEQCYRRSPSCFDGNLSEKFGYSSNRLPIWADDNNEEEFWSVSPQSVVDTVAGLSPSLQIDENDLQSLAADQSFVFGGSVSRAEDRSQREVESIRSSMENLSLTSSQQRALMYDSSMSESQQNEDPLDPRDNSTKNNKRDCTDISIGPREKPPTKKSALEATHFMMSQRDHPPPHRDSTNSDRDCGTEAKTRIEPLQAPLNDGLTNEETLFVVEPGSNTAHKRDCAEMSVGTRTKPPTKKAASEAAVNSRGQCLVVTEQVVGSLDRSRPPLYTSRGRAPAPGVALACMEQFGNHTEKQPPQSVLEAATMSGILSSLSSSRSPARPEFQRERTSTGARANDDVLGQTVTETTEDDTASVLTTLSASQISDLMNLRETVQQMRDNPNDADLQVRCCGEISRFFWDRDDWLNGGLNRGLYRTGVARDLLNAIHLALQEHLDHSSLPTYALQTCEYLCDDMNHTWFNDINRATIEKSITWMQREPSHSQIQENGCRVLASFAERRSVNRSLIVGGGGILAIVQAMKEHLFNNRVQEVGCLALAVLANCRNSCQQIAAHGGITVALEAIQAHTADYDIHENSCKALCQLAKNSPRNCRSIAGSLIGVMRKNAHSREIQKSGCRVLRSLSKDRENCRWIIAANGIVTVLEAMRANVCDVQIQESGCSTLVRLANCWVNSKSIIELDGVSVVAAAMDKHSSIVAIQEYGLQTLQNLLYFAPLDSADAIATASGISMIVNAMRRHMGNARLQTTACMLIQLMVGSTTTAANNDFVDNNGIPSLVSVMKHHNCNENIQESGCLVLRRLGMVGDPQCQQEIRDARAAEVIGGIKSMFPSSSLLQKYAYETLNVLRQAD